MSDGGYKIRDKEGIHFVTFAVVEWVDVFTRKDYRDILGDFKKYTGKQLIKAITEHPAESRKEWMLDIFKKAGQTNSRNGNYQFWQQDNQPKELFSEQFTNQKLEYIHNNPVEAGIVEKAEAYLYSSARDYYFGKNVGLLQIDFL